MSRPEIPQLTSDSALAILGKIIEELQTPEIAQKLEEARFNVGNEMLKMMQLVFPIVMQVQLEVIKEFGFSENREGMVKFMQMLRSLERDDTEVARLHSAIKAYYLPPVSVSANTEMPLDENAINSA